ncbi:concanavalin A-like lectin/glucanase domain-containing protein [Gigaspora rosea]|uniref:Concanavalin A-like lectin/glucanase domain-containing protein n=1 Tax=Gigaspora rosea TaxID=44941 RepID=A0A397VTF9_9GLOM|nr:concanavalin A-like lectin/glucanase domain-containing protein [Gigaspora rosea]
MPGCEPDSWGYHSDDGDFFNCAIINEPYGPKFTTGDTIGCCLNFINKTAFFTKNGVNLGIVLRDLKDNLYPCIGFRGGGSIETNFGHKKFKYAGMFYLAPNIYISTYVVYDANAKFMISID